MNPNQKTILIAEDEPHLRTFYATILTGQGFAVDTAGDGDEALKIIRGKKFDLLILDLYMPYTDGWGVLRGIAENNLKGNVSHILILTNSILNTSQLADSMRLGSEGYLIKSDFSPDLLMNEISKYLT